MGQTEPSWLLFSPAGARTAALDGIKRNSRGRRRAPRARLWTRRLAVLGRRGQPSRRTRRARPNIV